ncbi:MAG: MFS transporter [Saprospiraceae bacterium]|nr:MFS transporter [Saprospiraceae bacterium]
MTDAVEEVPNNWARHVPMLILIIAGETVFLLPFVIIRVFRPTFLDVFEITNFQLGSAFSAYGIVAMGSYFFGGPLADRFSAKWLMTIALVCTAAAGFIFALIPSLTILVFLYAFWGISTILLFWAALIRSTRILGGMRNQSKVFGVLDGGRGLLAAVLASLLVFIFASLLPLDVASASLLERESALAEVIWFCAFFTLGTAALVWWFIPHGVDGPEKGTRAFHWPKTLLRKRTLWLQSIIVVCAYVAYKSTDDFSLYVSDAFAYDDVDAARMGTISFWVRPVAAIAAGFLGDRMLASTVAIGSFVILIVGSLCIAMGLVHGDATLWLILVVVTTSLGIYAVRGIYFALFHEAKVPISITGAAIGIVSFIGYTPDVFMGPAMGYLIDRSPGAVGHQHVFALVAGFGFIGLLASIIFRKLAREQRAIQ